MITKGIVVAVGGNALIRDKHQISVESQSASIQESSRCIAALVDAGYTPVITHGNGPQVGFLLRRAELALEGPDLLAEARLGEVDAPGRPGEGARVEDRQEAGEVSELHVREIRRTDRRLSKPLFA